MAVKARFFVVKSNQVSKKVACIMPDNGDVSWLSNLKTWGKVGQFTHESQDYVLIKSSLPPYIIDAITNNISDGLEPLSIDAVSELKITKTYAGKEYSWEPEIGLYWFLKQIFGVDGNGDPLVDLSGQYDTGSIDEYGQPIMANYLINTKIAGE